jgi:3alpha(or 20beta)-hydroxysteroid dehydrogenase
MRLQGKVALVTGAAGGIGYAVAELFTKEGATVVAGDIASPPKPYPSGVEAMTLDVTSEGEWATATATIVEKHSRLDVLINNAGIIAYEPLHELDIKDWAKMIAVDQTGVFLGMREAVRVMRRQKSGSIVNISSIWGSAAVAGAHSYHAAKGAVRNMSKNAAMTYVGDGIRVNSVHPGIIDTPIWGKIPTGAQGSGRNAPIDPEERAKLATPLGYAGQARDIANGVLYLASDASRYVTGTELVIDGGMNAGAAVRQT